MQVLITGAGGMLGRKLTQKLAENEAVKTLVLADLQISMPDYKFAGDTICQAIDMSDRTAVATLIENKPDVIYHLAAIVSGEAEADFEKGYRVNLDATLGLLEAIRNLNGPAYCPRFVFTSSLAVFGGSLPDVIQDDQRLTPKSSYGSQKAMGELLVADYTRKGFIEGITLRLPTIVVRPGSANKAASGFYSAIIREPLAGKQAILPVPRSTRHWFQSPRAAVNNLAHAMKADLSDLRADRALNLPGCSASVDEMISALKQAARHDVEALIVEEADPAIANIVLGWPKAFNPENAERLGFQGEGHFSEIIEAYLSDDFRDQ